MKPILYVLSVMFLVAILAPVINAQSIEQISYMPVKKGNYTKLMVKKNAYFGGDLNVTGYIKAHATTLNLIAKNNLIFRNNPKILVNNNIFLSGTSAQVTNSVKVGSGNIFLADSDYTEIETLSSTSSIYTSSFKAVHSSTIVNIRTLYIDGVELPACTYSWQADVATADNGKYKLLKCN